MGVALRPLLSSEPVSIEELGGKIVAVDAFNWIFQFLSSIRLADGSFLIDKKGRTTTHLNGLFYRSTDLLKYRVKPIFVFDGKAPLFKKKTIEEREKRKNEARALADKAETEEERAMYLRRTTEINDYIIQSSVQLLRLLGIPVVKAPAEGEAQAAALNAEKKAFAVASQDYDSLLFGSTKLIRNLNISGRRKLPRRGAYVEVKPEIIDTRKLLEGRSLDREKLILIALFVGTDYNLGVKGIGPKKALAIVKNGKRDEILSSYDFGCEAPVRTLFDYFMHPNVISGLDVDFGTLDFDAVTKFMCGEHDFAEDRIRNALSKLSVREKGLDLYG